ncbi:antitoxin Xre/MbcA/ParS toxin-binding domain-containing protein [Pelobium manganitolerans]|uniref:antitoxin Xre/MbcA/ParS toxin-binding domain-containing protein n=1 Tax=Pelobium manganitolerans TaxID=1842495 RepID=UPI003FA3BBB9
MKYYETEDTAPQQQSIVAEMLAHYHSYFKSPVNKLSVIKGGLSSKSLLDLLEISGSTRFDLAKNLDLTEPTLRKHLSAPKELSTSLSEHVLFLLELYDKGLDTFGSIQEFKKWLPEYNIGIGAKPNDLLDSITGINIVMNELHRIDHGILA